MFWAEEKNGSVVIQKEIIIFGGQYEIKYRTH